MQQRTRGEASRRGRPVRRPAVPVDMRDHILDQAEALFARHGLHGVTVREVARSAGVDPALVHYYFDTKKGLFDAVFLRRAEILNEERMRSMDSYERAGARPHNGRGLHRGVPRAYPAPLPADATRAGRTTSASWRS